MLRIKLQADYPHLDLPYAIPKFPTLNANLFETYDSLNTVRLHFQALLQDCHSSLHTAANILFTEIQAEVLASMILPSLHEALNLSLETFFASTEIASQNSPQHNMVLEIR